MTQYRIGCLGAARIAPKALVDPAQVCGDAELSVVGARDLKRAEAFAERFGFQTAVEGYAAVIESPDVDLVYNPLPANLHAEWTIRALRAGKHVLCEKPFAMNLEEASAVLAVANETGQRVVEAFHHRYHPVYQTFLDWIAEGAIGTPRRFHAEFDAPIPNRGGREIRHFPETGGGAFMDLGCYPLAWALSVFGSAPETVTARATLTEHGVDETLSAELTFPDGARATLSTSMAFSSTRHAHLEIEGDSGRIRFENPLAPQMGASLTLEQDGKCVRSAHIDRTTTYYFQLRALLDALTDGSPLPTEGDAILRQHSLIDQIYAAAGLAHLRGL